ncbi:MAG TPA: SUMF1/EgtB/PvdO family nonheme iron enzyme [Myxococcota bacterium]|nr:SUMF1/EgtB/PvdO family nonheme iron enzyme [Myxococcota bacterium]
MVLLIAAGTATLGDGRAPDSPTREVELEAYRIDQTEVSIAAFEAWVEEGYATRAHWSDAGWEWAQAHPQGAGPELRAGDRSGEHPVVAVTFWEAEAFCAAGSGRLPTEAEWEHAACAHGSRYAWGDSVEAAAVWYAGDKYGHVASIATAPVSEQDPTLASPAGLLHTAGNVWEWTASSYHRDPSFEQQTPWRVVRGGSFANLPSYCTCTHREPRVPEDAMMTTGFRCAYAADQAG